MDLSTPSGRKQVIDRIESNENKGRKVASYKASEIINDRIKPYVIEELREQFSEETVRELPIVSSVNVAKRIVNSLACVYKDKPKRDFTEVSEGQKEIANMIYDDMLVNKKLNLANKVFKNHDQCLIQIIPKDGKLIMRILKPHQWDAVDNGANGDPETAKAIIVSSYDNSEELMEASEVVDSATGSQTTYDQNSESYKNKRAVEARDRKKRYLVWTEDENYLMDKDGQIVGEPMPNPIGVLPFIEVSAEKEFEYWVRAQNTFATFTVDFCATMSSIAQVVKLQGFSQAVLKCNPDMAIENVQIGPNYLLKLPVDINAGIDADFQYANPGSDISGSLQYLETLLTSFLSSNGIDPKTVSLNGESQSYSSGIERLLATIEKVSASREDYDVFEKVEKRVWTLIKLWLDALNNTDTLEQKYRMGNVSLESQVNIEYLAPELVKSDMEELEVIQREIDLGISSPIKAIMNRENLSREQAIEKFLEYQADSLMMPAMEIPVNGQVTTE